MANSVSVVLWDLMDTLVRDPFFTHMAPFFELTFEELLSQKHPTAWRDFETGEITEQELFKRFFRDGRAIDGAAFKRHVRGAYAWIDGMEPLVRELHATGVQMHLLSNYPPWYAMCDEQLSVCQLVEPSFVSCHTGVRKPSAEAYLGTCRSLGVRPEQCMFIDDRAINCSAAEALGMRTILFQGDAASVRAELAEVGLLTRTQAR